MAFKKGNIIRVSIKNFLTFDNVTIFPKPYLNLIIGPNGTGKSTILCAICMCLGGKADVTGRSKTIESYVKNGKEYAYLEVELFDEDGPNQVIGREFGRNISKWYLQGKIKLKKDIDAAIEKFSIKIDNLCTFLPQDRVANFARLNSIQLLEATEQAVGEPSLFECHELLRNNGGKMMQTKSTVANLAGQIDVLQRQNANMMDIVENVQEKARIEEDIKFYEKQKTYHNYESKRQKALEAESISKKQSAEVKKEKAHIAPYRIQIEQSKDLIKAKGRTLDQKIINFQKSSEKCNQLVNQVDELSEKVNCLASDFHNQKEAAEQRQREVQDYRRQLDALEIQLNGLPVMDGRAVKEKVHKLDQDIMQLSKKQSRIQIEKSDIEQQIGNNERSIKNCRTEIAAAQDVMRQRMQLLRQRNMDAFRAAEWLKDNGNKFSAPFYMPICTLLNIKDPAFANIVESSVSFNDLIAFVFEDKDEMNKFKSIMDKKKIRVNIIHSVPLDLSTFHQPVPIDRLRQLGFDVYMSDLIDAPPAVLSYLYKSNSIHRIPITRNEDVEYDNLPDKITLFFMGRLRVARSRSRYDGESITESSQIREGNLLKITVNHERISSIEQEILKCEKNNVEVRERRVELEALVAQIKTEMEGYKNEKQAYLSKQLQRSQLENRIKSKRKQIQTKESETFNEEEERAQMQDKISGIVKSMGKCVKEGQKTAKDISFTQDYYKIKSEMKLRKVFMTTMLDTISHKEEEIKRLEASLMKAEVEKNKYRAEAKHFLSKLSDMLDVKHVRDFPNSLITKFREMTEEETDSKLSDLKVRRDCIHTADEEEIRDYNEREAKISRLQKDLQKVKDRKKAQHKQIEEVRSKWVPCITELIANISSSFTSFMERMGCAGEVELIHDEDDDDYSKYGLALMVKFRGANKLRLLTAQHQSGGERAVSTALYMLSLQNLTSVPFRCVDEINQGMDPVNERMMLSMMMETAAKEESSQYFFVSPKLLPDLEYNDRVNTIIVYNGAITMPKDKFSLQDTMRRKRKLAAKRS